MPSVHAKLLKASPKAVYEKIVCVEMKSLEQQLKDAKSEQVCIFPVFTCVFACP